MDLGTITRKLAKEGSGGYLDHEEFAADVQLVFDNAMTYNGPVRVTWRSCDVAFGEGGAWALVGLDEVLLAVCVRVKVRGVWQSGRLAYRSL